jgi:hypothetical protein
MADKIGSISAKEIFGEIKIAIGKARANKAELEGVPAEPKFVMTPWLIGFILRELEREREQDSQTVAQVALFASEVVRLTPMLKHHDAATLIHDGRILCGYVQREMLEF